MFLINGMIGRNHHLFWPATLRAQDILPLVGECFAFQDFAPFFTLVNRFIGHNFGHNFDLQDPLHAAFLD